MGSLQKDIILNGSESLAVYKDNGVVWRASDIASYTPIVLRNIKANTAKKFDLTSNLAKDYKSVEIAIDVAFDNDAEIAFDSNNINNYYAVVWLTIIRNGVKVSHGFWQLYPGATNVSGVYLRSGDIVEVYSSYSLTSLTFYCQPVYLEPTIVVPEVIINAPVNSGNENPSPEPVAV